MIITATRRLQYAIGHRVFKHESKCRNLHGHNYVFLLTAQAPELDALGRVIDFGVIKEKFDPWFSARWDHGMILWVNDEEAIAGVRYVPGSKLFLLPDNPTAENMAKYVLNVVGPDLLKDTGVRLVHVRIFETENCIVDAGINDTE